MLPRPLSIPGDFVEKEEGRAWGYLVANSIVVLSSGVIAWHLGQWWAYVLAFIIVGARGQACYILQHELMHNLLFRSKAVNQSVGVVLSAMLGTRFFMGRRVHMEHHRLVGRAGDPNELFHNVEDRAPGWPITRFFLFHLLGGRLIWMAQNLLGSVFPRKNTAEASSITIPADKNRIDLIALLGVQAIIFVAISLASSPLVYFALYVLPLSTLTALFEALRSFSEHVLPGTAADHQAEQFRRFHMKGSWLELFFISQFDFHFHHIHHLYPNVVTFKVRRLHRWLAEHDQHFVERFGERPGYVETAIRYILNKPFPGCGAGYPKVA